MVGDGGVVRAGRVANGNAALARAFERHVLKAHAERADQLQVGQRIDLRREQSVRAVGQYELDLPPAFGDLRRAVGTVSAEPFVRGINHVEALRHQGTVFLGEEDEDE